MGGFEGRLSLPGSARAIARYTPAEDASICNLDDPEHSRLHSQSDMGAAHLEQGRWSGAHWWSYYDPAWSSFGLWDIERLALEQITPLTLDEPALVEASRTIVRRVLSARRL